MAQRTPVKTTFQPQDVIEPIYTGGTVALSEDGRIFASCVGEDVLLTDLVSGARLLRIEGDGDAVTTIALTPSASHIVICSRSLSMRIYSLDRDVESSRIISELLRSLKPHPSPIVTCVTDATGSLIATGGAEGLVKVWDVRGGYTTHTLHGHSSVVSALHFFKVDLTTTKLPDKDNRGTKRKRKGSESASVTDDTEGFMLASGSENGQMRIWNLQKRKCMAVLTDHVSVVTALSFCAETQILLSGCRDKTLMLWDSKSWRLQSTMPTFEDIEACGFHRRGDIIFAGGEKGKLRLWWTRSGDEITNEQRAVSKSQTILQLLNVEKFSFMLSVHADQTICLYSISALGKFPAETEKTDLPIIRRISGTHDEVIDLAYVGGSDNILAVATNLEEIRLISLDHNLDNGTENAEDPTQSTYFGADIGVLGGHEDIIICLDVDWSGHWLATGAKDNTARLWKLDPSSGSFECAALCKGHTESLGAIALPKQRPPPGSKAESKPLVFPPSHLVTGSQDKTIKRWDISSAVSGTSKPVRAIYTRKAHDKDINALDISYDSRLFVSASQDKTVKIWSIEDGEAVGILRGHKRSVWSAKFAPSDVPQISGDSGPVNRSRGLLLTGSGDKTVKIWSLSDFTCVRTFEGHTNSVLKVLWMTGSWQPKTANGEASQRPKGNVQIASAGGDGLVKVWDASSGELECTLDNHTDRVWALATSPQTTEENQILVSGGGDGVITFWKDTTTTTIAEATAASTARIEQDQQLQNLMRAKSYHSAITMALRLNHPTRLLSLFQDVVSTFPPEEGSLSGLKHVDEVLSDVSDEQLYALLCRIRDWNVNAKTAPVAQKVLWTLLNSYPSKRFQNLKSGMRRRGSSAGEVLDALTAYTDRHYRRMEELIDESYLVEYTLSEMDGVSIAGSKPNPIGVMVNGHQ